MSRLNTPLHPISQVAQDRINPAGPNAPDPWDACWIRALDLTICLLALPTLFPFVLLFGVLIKFTSRGPIFYHARRVGRHGTLFYLFKFRSMYINADRIGPAITVHNDSRVTPIGRFLRRTKLDELPQIFNVLRGEMSLVGPRPEDPLYVDHYTPLERQLLTVRPGITSMASLRYSAEETLLHGDNWEKYYLEQILPHKLALDAIYVNDYSVHRYLAILFASLVKLTGLPTLVAAITHCIRNRHIFAADLILLGVTPFVAWALLAGQMQWPPEMARTLGFFVIIATIAKISIYYSFGLYQRYWQYTGLSDLAVIVGGVFSATLLIVLGYGVAGLLPVASSWLVPITLPLIDGLLSGIVVGGTRLGVRLLNEWLRTYSTLENQQQVLLVGAGPAGVTALREIRTMPALAMNVVAFIDDDQNKIGTHIHGVPVVGPLASLESYLQQFQVHQLVMTLPTTGHAELERITDICGRHTVKVIQLPAIHEFLAGHQRVSAEPAVDVAKLLKREPLQIDRGTLTTLTKLMAGKVILVTGAGGSIGGELCRQIAAFGPSRMILLGHGENSIFEIGLELRTTFPDLQFEQVIADVRDTLRIDQIMAQYRPHVIFHAAAHKHVPLMQRRIEEAVLNNVLGTRNVLQAAERYAVPHFVLISTDKAIKPTSIMGATKRLAELLVQVAAQRSGSAYQAVRFGNVLGSRGSVLPIFRRQIAAGGPITITHPEMTRYFMTIPEAVQLVLQATVLGDGGEVFVLDMGEPVRILDLANGLLEMLGIDRQAVEIIFSGIRPGEKLHEELFQESEHTGRVVRDKIFVATSAPPTEGLVIEAAIDKIIRQARVLDSAGVLRRINDLLDIEIAIDIDRTPNVSTVRNSQGNAPFTNRDLQLVFDNYTSR